MKNQTIQKFKSRAIENIEMRPIPGIQRSDALRSHAPTVPAYQAQSSLVKPGKAKKKILMNGASSFLNRYLTPSHKKLVRSAGLHLCAMQFLMSTQLFTALRRLLSPACLTVTAAGSTVSFSGPRFGRGWEIHYEIT